MASFPESIAEYKKQLSKGCIQAAYKGLMDYFRDLRSYLNNNHPEYSVTSIYYGYMDMTYFAFTPEALTRKKLKIAIVFIHEAFRFEVWLSGANRDIQAQYWQLIKENAWSKYSLSPDPKTEDYIVSFSLGDDPDFSDLDALTKQIEAGTLDFIKHVERFLARHPGA